MNDFQSWKEREEAAYAIYQKPANLSPSSEGMKKVYVSSPVTEISAHYFVCCPNGIYKGNVKPRKTSKKPLQQKETKKMGYIYIFCMYVDELHSGQVTV